MKRKRKNRLAISRSTIRTLASDQLNAADGGRNAWGCYKHASISSYETQTGGCTVNFCRVQVR